MINFIFYTVLPPGASKIDETHINDDFLDLTKFFYIWPDSVNNFEYQDQLLNMHRFLTRSL